MASVPIGLGQEVLRFVGEDSGAAERLVMREILEGEIMARVVVFVLRFGGCLASGKNRMGRGEYSVLVSDGSSALFMLR